MSYFEKEAEAVFSKIEAADSIVIFGHKNPDGDCIGSVKGLQTALKSYFPNKRILAVGTVPNYLSLDFVYPADDVSDEIIQNSLAVMVDLSDLDRVEDQRIRMAKEIVMIDHHVASTEVNCPIVRDDDAPSATYVIAKLLLQRYHDLPTEAARFLFLGLVTDSGRFQFDSRPEVFDMAKTLSSYPFNARAIYNQLYQQNGTDLKYRSYIYSNFKEEGKVVFCKIPKDAWMSLGLQENEAGGKVNLLALLDHHPMWVTFTELTDGKVRTEYRSDGTYNVQVAAAHFGGGGHVCASGCTLDSLDKAEEVIAYLNTMDPIA